MWDTFIHTHSPLPTIIELKISKSAFNHFFHKFAMLLLHLFGLALLASKHVASLPTEVGFPLSERDDDCGGDLSKRAPCTEPVQCGSTHNPVLFAAIIANEHYY